MNGSTKLAQISKARRLSPSRLRLDVAQHHEQQATSRRIFLAAAWMNPPAELRAKLGAKAIQEYWPQAAALAQRVHQEPLFLHLLNSFDPEVTIPTTQRRDLGSQALFHAFRWDAIREATASLLDALARHNITPVLLKGIGLAGECYLPAPLRPMRDVDLLVAGSSLQKAYEVAQQCGFREHAEVHPDEKYERHHHAPPLFHAESGICLEIHHDLINPSSRPAGFPAAGAFLEATRPSRVFPGRAVVLQPTPAVLTLCAHITHGDAIGKRAQNLIDLARTIEADADAIDWAALSAQATAPALARCLLVPLAYLQREGLPSAPRGVLQELRQASRLGDRELRLLHGLIDRYRIGCPGPWPLISGRISNILWRETLRDASVPARLVAIGWQTLRRGK